MDFDDEQTRMEKALQAYLGISAEIVQRGFQYYAQKYGAESFKHTACSRASLINDHLVDEANRAFSEKHPEVALIKANGRRLFEVPNVALLHFKRLDKQKRTRNYPTFFNRLFNNPEEYLPGLGPLPRLAVGYVPSKGWTRIDSIFITRPDGKKVRWFIELGVEGQPPQPIAELQPNDHTPSKRRTRPKHGTADRKGADQS